MSVLESTRDRIGGLLAESVYDNPVVVKEFRTRMRGTKGFAVMGGYVLLLAVVMMIAYYAIWTSYGGGNAASLVNEHVGQDLFLVLSWAQTILLTLVVPSLTANALTHEVEKKTIQMLALTRLTPGKIVLGKGLSGFGYAMVLVVCSLPLASMCLMFGGISPLEIAVSYALLIAWVFLLSSAAVFWSSLANKSANASGNSVGLSIMYFIFTASYGASMAAMRYSRSSNSWIFGLMNPAWAPYGALLSAKVCGLNISIAFAAFAYHVAMGILLLLLASTHVRYCRVERALSIRLLLLGMTVVFGWMGVGNAFHLPGLYMNTIGALGSVYIWLIIQMSLVAFLFATGPIRRRPDQSMVSYSLSPRLAFKSDLGGGICFMLLYTAVSYAVYGLTVLWAGQFIGTALPLSFWPNYFELGITALCVVAGISAVGVCASSIASTRKGAVALMVLFTVLAFVGYGIIGLSYAASGMSEPGAPLWQTAALWPLTPGLVVTGTWDKTWPVLWWPLKHSWIVVSFAYLVLGMISLFFASLRAKKFKGVQEDSFETR